MKGWMGKVLRVNLTKRTCVFEELPTELLEKYVGIRGLAAHFMWEEVDPNVDALGPDNELMFFTGPCTGTLALGATRYMAVTKSPLTGVLAGSNSGGFFPYALKTAGVDGIIFEGKASSPVYLWLSDDGAEIRPADHIWGQNVESTQELIHAETHPKARIACIGRGGEKLVLYAAIMNDNGRAAGRSGVGAVMGSKNLKAVAAKGSAKIEVADPERLRENVRAIKAMFKLPSAMATWGTPYTISFASEAGVLCTRNFTQGVFEGVDKLTGQVLKDTFLTRGTACRGCIMACGRESRTTARFGESLGDGPEMETIGAFGSNCGIDDLEAVCYASHLCNEYGLDTISMGQTIACAMAMVEAGAIPDTDSAMRFGDVDAMLDAIRQTGDREGFGEVLAAGSARMAESYGRPEFAMCCRKQELSCWEPRGVVGLALAYATSNRGADHTRAMMENPEVIGIPVPLDRFATEGKPQYVAMLQNQSAILDSMGFCQFWGPYRSTEELCFSQINAVTGIEFDYEGLMHVGERIWNLERSWNVRAGSAGADDRLPVRAVTEPLPDGTAAGRVVPLEVMLPEYYAVRGWTEDGVPTIETLRRLDLPTDWLEP